MYAVVSERPAAGRETGTALRIVRIGESAELDADEALYLIPGSADGNGARDLRAGDPIRPAFQHPDYTGPLKVAIERDADGEVSIRTTTGNWHAVARAGGHPPTGSRG